MDEIKDDQNTTDAAAGSDAEEICRSELTLAKERYLYLQAEFDNYKKRVERERASWIDAGQDVVIIDLLAVVDDFERALQELESMPQELHTHKAGFEMIAKSVSKILKKYDVDEIPFTKTFNPEYFEAVMQVTRENHASGDIVAILQKGYTRKGRVLRPAKVSVAQ